MSAPVEPRGALFGAPSQRRDWIAAALVGATAWTPTLLAIVGWVSHWNVYTNLSMTLVGPVYWLTIWKAWK